MDIYTLADVDEMQILALIDPYTKSLSGLKPIMADKYDEIMRSIKSEAAKVIVESMNNAIRDVIRQYADASGGPLLDVAMKLTPQQRADVIHTVTKYHSKRFKMDPLGILSAASNSLLDEIS